MDNNTYLNDNTSLRQKKSKKENISLKEKKSLWRKHFVISTGMLLLPLFLAIAVIFSVVDLTKQLNITKRDGIVNYVYGSFPVNRGESLKSTTEVLDALNELRDIYEFTDVYSEFKLEKITENVGGYVLDFDQYYNGIPVYPRELKVQVTHDFIIDSISGNYLKNISPRNRVQLSALAAEEIALKADCIAVETRLIVFTLNNTLPVFAYEVLTTENLGTYYYVNAETGSILSVISASTNVITPHETTQTDYFGESVELTIAQNADGTYSLIDGYRNINVKYSYSSNDLIGYQYTNDTGIFDDETKKEPTAINTLLSITRAFDFYSDIENLGVASYGVDNSVRTDIFGVAPMSGQKQINIVIEVTNSYDNASCASNFPNQGYTTFYFGGARNYALAPDVAYHEYQHSVTRQVADLIYVNESGALDEALADLFAGLVEGHPMSDNRFWTIAEEMPTQSAWGGTVRSAINPSWYGGASNLAQWYYPYCYLEGDHNNHKLEDGNPCDAGGVHVNATVITHAFYQMYKNAEAKGLVEFNNQNLGKMLFSTLQQITRDSTWIQFADIFSRSPYMLGLSQEITESMVDSIRQGFIATTIYYRESNHAVIRFALGEGQTGELPEVISVEVGTDFVLPSAEITHELGGTFVGWSEFRDDGEGIKVYEAGETITSPHYSITFYPVIELDRWNNFTFSGWDNNGSKESPYLVKTAGDLAALAYYMNSGINPQGSDYQEIDGKYFRLTADINLESVPWIPIGIYESLQKTIYFEGNNHTIRGINLNGSFENQGLFGYLRGEVSGITLSNGTINVEALRVGGIAGFLDRGARVSNCFNKVAITNTMANGIAGGIVGAILPRATTENIGMGSSVVDYTLSSIQNCRNSATVSANIAGGIVGSVDVDNDQILEDRESVTPIGNCINTATITGKVAGGIAGRGLSVLFVNCVNSGTIFADGYTATLGGIVGHLNFGELLDLVNVSALLSCKNSGTIQKGVGNSTAGGMIGIFSFTADSVLRMDNNIIKSQSGISVCGTNIPSSFGIADGTRISYDNTFEGDFAFSTSSYYYDGSYWSVANGISAVDFITCWNFYDESIPEPTGSNCEYWTNSKADSFGGGSGTLASPYIISSAAELALLEYRVNNGMNDGDGIPYANKYYLQTENIDLAGKLWVGIGRLSLQANGNLLDDNNTIDVGNQFDGRFAGHYDGGGHNILNMYVAEKITGKYINAAALFSAVSSEGDKTASIRNLNLIGMVADGNRGAAGIVFNISGNVTINNCIVTGGITSSAGEAAGIVAISTSRSESISKGRNQTISNVLNLADISAPSVAGIISSAKSKVNTLVVKNAVNRGEAYSYILGSYGSTTITAGIAAAINGYATITSAINTGSIHNYGYGYVSGICGYVLDGVEKLEIFGCKQSGDLYATSSDRISSLLYAYFGEYKNITIKNSHYTRSASDTTLFSVEYTVVNSGYDGSAEAYNYEVLEFFADDDYFVDIDEYYSLYALMNFEQGYSFIIFVNYLGELREITKVAVGEVISPPNGTPTRASDKENNYSFAGWSVMGSGGTIITEFKSCGNTVYIETFNAEKIQYMVRYFDVGGTLIETEYYTYGEVITLSDFTKSGYTFEGWYLDSSLNTKVTEITIEENTDLYAKWAKDKKSCLTISPSAFTFLPLLLLPLLAASFIYQTGKKSAKAV